MREGIIFDVDGTMWDSTEIVKDAWNSVLIEENIPLRLTEKQLQAEFGKALEEIRDDLLPMFPMEQRNRILQGWFRAEEAALLERMPRVYDGLEEMLQALSERYFLFVVSNAQSGYIELFLKKTGFGHYFQDYTCNGDTGLPKAGNIRLMMDRFHLDEAVYVGDTQLDCTSAKEARAAFAYASYGFGTADTWDYFLREVRDLRQLL